MDTANLLPKNTPVIMKPTKTNSCWTAKFINYSIWQLFSNIIVHTMRLSVKAGSKIS